ncbi:hypothetical protein [Hafnia alvei]|uniref:Uncharacterized protein n=1 Tax=Hafnia alvei TaxID=569 RepID=A0A1C6Z4N0_HAFAL|nr:hypothetical protein [Hafnia alvei]NLS52164.1 hypothetical protein [Hafnia alvei]SCM54150.1 hypothetical protein BN1044_03649 [Hafnia alvei]
MDGSFAIALWSSFLSVIYLIALSVVILGACSKSLKCRHILFWVEAPQIISVFLFSVGMHWHWWRYVNGGVLGIVLFSVVPILLSLIVAILVSRWLGHPFHLWIVCHIIFITLLWSIISRF